jgi:hypothetical protein
MPTCAKEYLVLMSFILEDLLQGGLLLLINEQEFPSEMCVESVTLDLVAKLSDG